MYILRTVRLFTLAGFILGNQDMQFGDFGKPQIENVKTNIAPTSQQGVGTALSYIIMPKKRINSSFNSFVYKK